MSDDEVEQSSTFDSLTLPLRARLLAMVGFHERFPARSWVEAMSYMRSDPTMFAEWLTQRYGANNALDKALVFNDVNAIKLLTPLADPDVQTDALIRAARDGNDAVVRALIDKGAPINCIGVDEPLETAIYAGHGSIARMLLDAGANVYRSHLEAALFNGNIEVVRMMFDTEVGKNFTTDDDIFTEAAEHDHIEVVRMMLTAGANVHADDDSAFKSACRHGNIEMVRLLLSAGAHVDANQDEPLQLASVNGHVEVVRLLLNAGAHVNAVHESALRKSVLAKQVDVVRVLIAAGAWVNVDSESPLNLAVELGDVAMVRLLLESGARVTGQTETFVTPYGPELTEMQQLIKDFSDRHGVL